MAAQFIPIGEPAHDPERQAIRFLVEGLPSDYTLYGNAWLVERSGVIYELDAVVVAPHAVFVVEIKSYRGRIDGTDHDWYIPHPIASPLKLNRLTAQTLKSQLRRESYQAGQLWVEGLVFLSATTDIGVKGPASRDRIHSRKTILAALQDPALVERLSARRSLVPTSTAEKDVLQLFTGVQGGPKSVRPVRKVREYEIVETLDHLENFTELLGKNSLSGDERVLRIYSVPPLATDEQRHRVEERARWEAQVLGRLGRIEGILSADPPFADEAGIVLPLERFKGGISLPSWLERYGPDSQGARGKEKADLRARTDLWIRIATTIDDAHRQGVVHRLLRPEVILVEDRQDPQHVRITGFDLAKQISVETAISFTTLADDRLVNAAPEVVAAFSSAEPASDQFSLGAVLALLLTGKPLFESTRQLMAARRLMRRVRDMAQRIPLRLDEAVSRMVELRPTDRHPSLADAIAAVRAGRDPEARTLPNLVLELRTPLDADNLAAVSLEDLERRVRRMFGKDTPYPDPDHLLELLRDLDCRVQGELVLPGRIGSIIAGPPLSSDAVPSGVGADRSPEEVVRDMLRAAYASRGFRMLITPPERHPEIARSVAAAIDGTWVSFEDAFFSEHRAALPSLERAERFVAQREALTEAAEETLFRLLDEHGQPGKIIVLGDTALLGLCEALDLPRRLYDETLSGSRGFWVLVVPGVIHNRQPRFNEGPPMWHLDGATLPLVNPLPARGVS